MNRARTLFTIFTLTALSAFANDDLTSLVKQGDAADARLDNARALELYLQAEKQGANDAETLYRIARQYALTMDVPPTEDAQRLLGEKALSYAKRAIAADPTNAKAQLSAAICYGRLVSHVPTRTKVEYSRLIKQYADVALKLDPTDSYAWHVLGAWNYEMAQMGTVTRAIVKVVYGAIPSASNAEAVRLFTRAAELAPQRVSHHVELGRALAALGKKDQARAELQKALALPNQEKDDPESKRRATQALSDL